MNKKLIGIILGIGALVAIGLGVVLSLKTKELKSHMQQTLNTNLESFASKHADLITQWEPFSCSGIIKVGCYSPKIVIGDSERKAFILKDVGFDIDSMDSTSLKASLNIKDIKLEDKSTEQQTDDEKKWASLLLSFMPHKLQCDVSLKHDDDKLLDDFDCSVKAKNANYQIENHVAYQHESFKSQNLAQILQNFYFKWLLEEDSGEFDDYKYSIKDVMFKIQDNGFSKDIYKLYEQLDKQRASQEDFEKAVAAWADGFVSSMAFVLGDIITHQAKEMKEATASFAVGKSKELSLLLQRKTDKEAFLSFEDLDELAFIEYIRDNFTLKVINQ